MEEDTERVECISAAQICLLGKKTLQCLPRDLINPQHLDKRYEDSDAEVDGANGISLGDGGQRHAALAKRQHQRMLALEYEIGNGTVQGSDQEAHQQPSDFQRHDDVMVKPVLSIAQSMEDLSTGIVRNRGFPLCVLEFTQVSSCPDEF